MAVWATHFLPRVSSMFGGYLVQKLILRFTLEGII